MAMRVRNLTKHDGNGMSGRDLERFLDDMHNQPHWRREADIEADYYDGNQLDAETLELMAERGIPAIVTNLIKPTVDTVLGMEAKTRTDWYVAAEAEQHKEMADALNIKLKEHARLARANRATADAYAHQIKVGLGWVEVAREADPFKPPYRVRSVSRREVWWDWRAKEQDLSDARYLVRRKWFDVDVLATQFPKHKELIEAAASNEQPYWDTATGAATLELYRDERFPRDVSIEDAEWRDTERQRLALYEVWYRVWVNGFVLKLPDGRVIEFDKKNPQHKQAVAAGFVKPTAARFSKVRRAWWLGPHQLDDEPTPYPHNAFPYVPFWGFREDRTGIPYGMIRAMRSPQDEINARRSKMMWLLSARRVIADKDAVTDHTRTQEEVSRADAYIITDPNRKNLAGFQVQENSELSSQQYQVLLESKQNIQDASGVFREMRGNPSSSGQSGVAINALVEQGTISLAEINDNYRDSRELVGELLLTLIVEDMAEQDNIEIELEAAPGQQGQVVMLNVPDVNEVGQPYRQNDVTKIRAHVALTEVPTSATYRQQFAQQLMQLTSSLPPQIQAAVIDIVVESSELPNKTELADRIRQAAGIGKEEDPAAQEAAAQQQQMAMEMAMAQLQELQAKVGKLQADAMHKQAQAQKLAGVDTGKTEAEMALTRSQTRKTTAETLRVHQQLEQGEFDHELDVRDRLAPPTEAEVPEGAR